MLDPHLVEKKTYQGLSFDRNITLKAEGGFITTEVMCLNPHRTQLYWFRGNGLVSRIDIVTLEKEDYDISLTSSL